MIDSLPARPSLPGRSSGRLFDGLGREGLAARLGDILTRYVHMPNWHILETIFNFNQF